MNRKKLFFNLQWVFLIGFSLLMCGCMGLAGLKRIPFESFPTSEGPKKPYKVQSYKLNKRASVNANGLMMKRRDYVFYERNDALQLTNDATVEVAPIFVWGGMDPFALDPANEPEQKRLVRTFEKLPILGLTEFNDRKCYIVDVGLNMIVNEKAGPRHTPISPFPADQRNLPVSMISVEGEVIFRGLLIDFETKESIGLYANEGNRALKIGWVTGLKSHSRGQRWANVSPQNTKFIPGKWILFVSSGPKKNYDLVFEARTEDTVFFKYKEYGTHSPDIISYETRVPFEYEGGDKVFEFNAIRINVHEASENKITFTVLAGD